MKVKVESENVGLKLNIQKMKIMASSPITSWEIGGETVSDIKINLLLGRKATTILDSILKSRHYFANKGPSSQGYGFASGHVWM